MMGILGHHTRKESGPTHKPKRYGFRSPTYRDPNAMDVDALLAAATDDWKMQYKCYNCDKPGHFAKDCKQPKRKKGNFPQKKTFHGKGGKKQWTPGALRAHVRSIMDDMDEEDQEAFYAEAEEEGF
jgi:hypothetical protein